MPRVTRLAKTDRLYHLATCAYYRPKDGIVIMVEKCAILGMGGRAWSWPGYAIDRTPYGVIAHELAHHLDFWVSKTPSPHFSTRIYELSGEPPLTGYLGTDSHPLTRKMEWFAENMRLFITNPDLCGELRPKFYRAVCAWGFLPCTQRSWRDVLADFEAPARIIEQAAKKAASI